MDPVGPEGWLPRLEFSVSQPEVVCTASQRHEHDLYHWIDGTMGVVRTPDRTLAVSPNGPRLVVHRSGPTALGGLFAEGLAGTGVAIAGLPPEIDHASGGPLLRDEASGRLVLVYHGEHFTDGDPTRFYSFLGLAVSDDEGVSFRDLGPIVRPAAPEHDHDLRPIEVGPGPVAVVGDQLHVYFVERSSTVEWLRLGAARCPLADVFAAAAAGAAPEFRKYHDGRFGEPGLGGAATELLPTSPYPVLWMDVTRLAEPNVLLLIHSTVARMVEGVASWERRACCSVDGVRWTLPVPIDDEPFPAELLYLTIDSGGLDQRVVEGDEFDLYRVAANAPYRWHDARVERQRVRFRVNGSEPVTEHVTQDERSMILPSSSE